MMAGRFAKAGGFMGDNFWVTRDANPKGFFEDQEINEINEDLLEPVVSNRWPFFGKVFFQHQPIKWQHWLACLPPDVDIPSPFALIVRNGKITPREPFFLKDVMISYALPVWRLFLGDTVSSDNAA